MTNGIDSAISPDGVADGAELAASAAVARGDDNPFIKMLKAILPPVPKKAIQLLTSGTPGPSIIKSGKQKTILKKKQECADAAIDS